MIEIHDLKLESNIMLAPIAGYTDSPFRRIARKHGAGLVVTELISDEGIIRQNEKTMDLLKFHEEERPIAIQIFGRLPEVMAEAAAIVEELKPDLIDINMGCPAQKVCKSGKGAALLKEPGEIEIISKSIVRKTGIPVSAKIRIGWDEYSKNYIDIVKALEAGGISLIIVHGRTRVQKYGGESNWDIIREIREISSVPVIGNGDILSHEEAVERMNFSGCMGVMIGRGAIGNPWIFSGERPSIGSIISQIKEHLEMMIEYYGERGIILMRKHLVKYIHGFRNARTVRRKLVTSTSKDEIFQILDTLTA